MSYFEGPSGDAHGTLVDIFVRSAAAYPKAVALEAEEHSLTYRQLKHRAMKWAKRLKQKGISTGDRVVIQVPTGGIELYEAILGVLFAGATYVPMDAEDSSERLNYVVQNSEARAIISEAGLKILHSRRDSKTPFTQETEAWVIFTSGSTGDPKAVAVTHANAVNFVEAEQKLFHHTPALRPGARVAATLSPAFDASVEEMWLAWRTGGTLVAINRQDLTSGPDLPKILVTKEIDVFSTVPSLARFLVGAELGKVGLLILGGEAITPDLANGLFRPGLEVWNTYGPTEATVITTATKLEPGDPITIGMPISGTAIAIVDAEGRPIAMGETGELVIHGKGLGRYLSPSEDLKKFRPLDSLGWERSYFTGDFVKSTNLGLEFVGRIDEQVKLGGKRIDLAEIELAASKIEVVSSSAAIAIKDAFGDYQLHCFVTANKVSESIVLQNDLRKHLASGISPSLHVLDALPTKLSGKIDKSALAKILAAPVREDFSGSVVAKEFARVLGLANFGEDDNFFTFGGTSIRAALLTVNLRKFHQSIAVSDIYRNPTPSSLEKALTSRNKLQSSTAANLESSPGASIRSLAALVLQLIYGTVIGGLALLAYSDYQNESAVTAVLATMAAITASLAGAGRAIIAGGLVRAVTFGIKPGHYSKNGSVRLRIWLAERICDMFFIAEIAGTPWMILYSRITGSKVAKHCTIESLPPVLGSLVLGEGSSIGRDVHISGWTLENEKILVAGYDIGSWVRVGNRSFISEGVTIADHSEIEAGSLVNQDLAEASAVQGSPLESNQTQVWPGGFTRGNRWWILAYAVSPSLFALSEVVSYIPGFLFYGAIRTDQPGISLGAFLVTWAILLGPISLVVRALVTGVSIRIATLSVEPGFFASNSRQGYSSWLVERLIQRSRHNSFWLYASVLTPIWLRFIGAKVGKNCEISTLNGQVGLLELGDECFIADDASLAVREMKNGWVKLGRVRLSNRSFIGNSAQVKLDTTVEREVLVAVASQVPLQHSAGDSFLGLPPIEFPRLSADEEEALRYQPTISLRFKRLSVELFRLLPATVSFSLLGFILLVTEPTKTWSNPFFFLACFGASFTIASYLASCVTAGIKWVLVGRVKKGDHNLWTNFVWRNELVWNFVELLAIPWTSLVAIDTPVHNHLLRLMGAKIGKGSSIATWFVDDPDLVSVGANCTVMKSADIQTHLFHDRLMQLDSVSLGDYSVLGSGSFMLPGSSLGSYSEVSAGSLVARNEALPSNSRWLGNPVEYK